MKKPIIYSDGPIFSQGDYDVVVGALEENTLPQYVIINRNTGVVEFTNEITGVYKAWLDHFAPPAATAESQAPLNFSFTN